jgi:hypothetical protein
MPEVALILFILCCEQCVVAAKYVVGMLLVSATGGQNVVVPAMV